MRKFAFDTTYISEGSLKPITYIVFSVKTKRAWDWAFCLVFRGFPVWKEFLYLKTESFTRAVVSTFYNDSSTTTMVHCLIGVLRCIQCFQSLVFSQNGHALYACKCVKHALGVLVSFKMFVCSFRSLQICYYT